MSRDSVLPALTALVCLGLVSSPAVAEDPSKKFQVFGYLTQAYGNSSRGSVLGNEPDGTTDLSNIALQFRWNQSDRDTVVVQLAHERRGEDLFVPNNDDVDIDWAFYERRVADNTILKVGRLNIPLGIYNEVRDVGTLLPFFNLPISFYAGVPSSAETVDGVSISHTFGARTDWGLDVDLYVGGWDTVQNQGAPGSRFGLVNVDARAEDGVGIQFWLNTPVRGLRLGAGALNWKLDGPLALPERDRWETIHFSFDLATERWILRGEIRHWDIRQDFGPFIGSPMSMPADAHRQGHYVQAGVWLTEKIGLFAQIEETDLRDDLDLIPFLDDFHTEAALSLNYRFNPSVQARVEFHTSETKLPLGLPPTPGIPVDVDWAIAAFSVSF